jgi:CRISPR system Cascade subunit CasE
MTSLTQIRLSAATVARLGIRDVYDWHQRTWECFPCRDGQPRDFLTRLDRKGDSFQLLIVSPAEPTRPAWCPGDCWRGPKLIPESYFSRTRYRFQLCANPTKKVAVQNPDGSFKKNSRRVPLGKREDLIAWLQRKGEQGGFSVEEDSLRIIPRGREYFQKNGQTGLHTAVEFQGVLVVTDPQRFHEAFRRGVGPARAFGFGLLVIAPVR